jgi:hypothetical protein
MLDGDCDHPAWVKLKQMHDHGDFEKLERMVKLYDGLEAMGSLGSLVTKVLIWCAGLGGGYLIVENWIRGIK